MVALASVAAICSSGVQPQCSKTELWKKVKRGKVHLPRPAAPQAAKEHLNQLPRSMFTAFRCFTGQCETIEGASRSWDLAYSAVVLNQGWSESPGRASTAES